jgi:anti-sigma factor RsiW
MDENRAPASRSFARWWLGRFGGVGAVVAAALGTVFNAGFLASLGFAVLGLIVGLELGFGVAEVVVRDLRPPVSVELSDGWAR